MPFGPTATRRWLPVAFAAAIALTGCGSSDSTDAGPTVPTTTLSAATIEATMSATATTLATASQVATPAASPVGASTGVSGSYCDAALQAQAATNAFNALGADPHSTTDPAAVFDAYVATINKLAATAPTELVADLQRNADAMAKLKPILAGVRYDVAKAFEDPAINTILTAEVNAGSQRINDYNASTCGLSGASTTTSLATP